MKVKLLNAQHYITVAGAIKCGNKGDVVDVDPKFLKLINGKYELAKGEVQEDGDDENDKKPVEKPLDKMNKEELVAKAKSVGIELEDAQFEEMTKAQITEAIKEVIEPAE